MGSKRAAREQVGVHKSILTDLDELGEILTEMLERQEVVEVCVYGFCAYIRAQ